MWETQVRSLGPEDPLEKEMAIYSSTIAWKIPWTEEPGRLQSMGSQRVGHDWATSLWLGASLVAQRLKHLPTMQETWVRSLGWEDPLEKEVATHSSTLAWKIPWTEEPAGYSLWGHKSQTWLSTAHAFLHVKRKDFNFFFFPLWINNYPYLIIRHYLSYAFYFHRWEVYFWACYSTDFYLAQIPHSLN